MNGIDDRLRDLLQRKADEVPPHRQVPRSLVGRARRRVALNAVGAGIAVVVVIAGAVVGVRALGTNPTTVPVHRGPSPSITPAPPPPSPSVTVCTSLQLRARQSLQGAAGSREGAFVLTNTSRRACTLKGTPAITLFDSNGKPITSGVSFGPTPPGWQANSRPKPPGWPVVTVRPGKVASARIRWNNWCLPSPPAQWRVSVPGGGTLVVTGMVAVSPPPCNGPGLPSTIAVGPFEPGPGT